jgi:(R,R)-butanediol dehydrogenase/meso-butanediol dehydrogenase/diacetyl reductase
VGAATVVIAEPNPNRAALAVSMGIGPVLDPGTDGFASLIGDLTEGVGVDLAIECSGSTPGLATCVTHARRRGSIVQTGLHTKPATLDAMALSEKDLTLFGSWCYRLTDWPRVIRMIASGRYPVAKAVTAQIALADVVTKGFDVLVDPKGDQLKVLVHSGANT